MILLALGCAPPSPTCEVPAPPLAGRRVAVPALEDLDLDSYGNVVGSDGRSLIWSTRAGEVEAIVPGIQAPAGLRFLHDDSLVVAAVSTGELLRLYPDGGREPLLTGLNWPNGVAVAGSLVLVSELSGGRVWWVDVDAGDSGVLAEIERPNGLAVDGETVLVGTMTGAGEVYRVPLAGGSPQLVVGGVGAGDIDGVGVDACGHLYVADYEGHRLLRLHDDGTEEVLLDRTAEGGYLPGFRWGSGLGGWRADALYVVEQDQGTLWELDVGVGGG